ncbi:MAG: agmatine deiminase family protein [Pseudomonadota bacterium]
MNNYYMPPEWMAHKRCWMAWPTDATIWSTVDLYRIRSAYAAIANAISHFEPLTMVVAPEDADSARSSLVSNIEVLPLPIDDAWMRDSGPTFVINRSTQEKIGIAWQFNGWGGKFEHDKDQHVARLVSENAGVSFLNSRLTNEGGAFHVDGEGTCLLTENVQLNNNRNPGFTKSDVEGEIGRWLGIKKFIWFPKGLTDDHTDGHVDQMACFIAPTTDS